MLTIAPLPICERDGARRDKHIFQKNYWVTAAAPTPLNMPCTPRYISQLYSPRRFPICRQLRTVKLHQITIIFNAALKRFEDRDFNPAVSDPTVSDDAILVWLRQGWAVWKTDAKVMYATKWAPRGAYLVGCWQTFLARDRQRWKRFSVHFAPLWV